MDFWIKAAQLMLSLAILITLHEFGHFFAARWFKIRVEKFYLFFDPWFSLFKKKIGDTEWGIGWLPLGGYVKIAGMVDESMDKEQLALPPQPDEFRSKPAWQRLIVMIGGVTVNVIVGFFIYILVVFAWGETHVGNDQLKYGLAVNKNIRALNLGIEDGDIIEKVDGQDVEHVRLVNIQVFLRGARKLDVRKQNGQLETIILPDTIKEYMWANDAINAFDIRFNTIVDSVFENTGAAIAGLQKGDSIVSVNGNDAAFFHLFTEEINTLTGDSAYIQLGFYREGEFMEQEVLVRYNSKEERYVLGFVPKTANFITPTRTKYGFGESIARGFSNARWTMHDYVAQLPLIFTSKGASSVGGFGAIGSLFPSQWNWERFWLNTAFISLVLAIMNILPIPALDGGHIVFLLYEMITGKEAPQKVLEYAQIVGFALLLTLLLYANGNDIYRAFFK
jgi:regulator of sigma E protease